MRFVCAVALTCLLAGCADLPQTPAVRLEVIHDHVPGQLLSCEREPAAPINPTNASTAQYMLDVVEAGRDCRSKVGAIRNYTQAQGAPEAPASVSLP